MIRGHPHDMEPFRILWSPVPGAAPGMEMFALWPSPVNDDVCFREAGFTDFGDGDENWEGNANDVLTRLLDDLSRYGPAHLVSAPVERHQPWYCRLFGNPEVYDLREQIELPMEWDELPDCIVAFGVAGATLRTGSGHHIFWITVPWADAASFPRLVERVAASHPIVRTGLRWEYLL
ncbi:MAG: hypothetical protein JWM16_1630 [Verrucomicrobiales bacterium]|nr:hypothetical protein [Verrucomicrobiales bacterium]